MSVADNARIQGVGARCSEIPTPATFIETVEQAFAMHVHAPNPVRDSAFTAGQSQFLAGLVRYCERSVFTRTAKLAPAVAPGIDAAWRAAGGYLSGSLGRFEMADLAKSACSGGPLPLHAGRWLLDTALLQRLTVLNEPRSDRAARTAALRDLTVIAKTARTPWLGQIVAFEAALNRDPSGIYPSMDTASKDAYRARVEALAGQFGVEADDVVARALQLCAQARQSPGDHVGYYLIDEGIAQLRSAFGKTTARKASPWGSIVGHVLLQACMVAAFMAFVAWNVGAGFALLTLVYLGLIGIVCADSLKASVELLLGHLSRGRPSLAIDFVNDGLPENESVLIAVPMHLVNIAQWERALETARWNMTQANDTSVALLFLTDFPDAAQPGDSAAEQALLAHVLASLRDSPITLDGRPFAVHLLHRDREFVAGERCWMGKERKRGKLTALNRLIVHGEDGFSAASDGAHSACRLAKYVLCLDEDARLTRHALQRMAGFLAHPLNRPRMEHGRIRAGHGLAVPCTMTAKESVSTWRWPRFSVGPSVHARDKPSIVRNFMFDWFGQAPYSGKGMYEPGWFETLCADHIPNGMVLSHDTMEAAWLRPGYVDKALVTDAYPASFRSFIERQDRWVRGDLQNAAIVLGRLVSPAADRPPPLAYFTIASQVHAWLSNAAVFAVFALMIAADASAPWWHGALLAMMLGGYQRLLVNGYRDRMLPPAERLRIYLPYFVRIHLAQLVRLAASPLYALVLARAAVLTGWRLTTRRGLLQWRSAAIADADHGRLSLFAALAWTVAMLAAIALYAQLERGAEPGAVAVLGLWTLTPVMNKVLTRSV